MSTTKTGIYSLDNAIAFGWGSISGNLDAERVRHLRTYMVGESALDAGCGGGGYVNLLTEQGFNATGVDKFGEFLEVAKQLNFKGTFIQSDIASMPFEDKVFDTTICFDVLEHVDDVAAMRELVRVTKKRLIVTVPRKVSELMNYSLTTVPYVDLTHLRYYTEESLGDLFRSFNPLGMEIFPAHPVNFGYLVQEMLNDDNQPRPNLLASSRDRKETLQRRLLRRVANNRYFRQIYWELFVDPSSYRPIYCDLFGVVDLA